MANDGCHGGCRSSAGLMRGSINVRIRIRLMGAPIGHDFVFRLMHSFGRLRGFRDKTRQRFEELGG